MEIKRYLLVQWLTESRFGKTKFGQSRFGAGNSGFWERDYGWGPGTSPFWRTRYEFCGISCTVIYDCTLNLESLQNDSERQSLPRFRA
jgi:hypothetical protein